jgi:hypothetical protein
MNNNINFKELRLDNYICINNNLHPCRVKEITMSSVVVESIKENYSEPTINSMNPLPLTEEWLLKFGFEETDPITFMGGLYSIKKPDGFYINKETMSYCTFDYEGTIDDIIKIEYVHQLQNLYFAVTGEELTMK